MYGRLVFLLLFVAGDKNNIGGANSGSSRHGGNVCCLYLLTQAVMSHAPIRLLKLEFVLPEEKFDLQMNKAEMALQQHREQLNTNTNVKDALQKHRVGKNFT